MNNYFTGFFTASCLAVSSFFFMGSRAAQKINEPILIVGEKGTTKIGDGTVIGCNAIWNGGGNITVGKNCIFSARSSLNANEHNFNKQKSGKELFFNYGEITIADECFIGINSSIALNTSIGEGAVVGAHSFVNSNLESFSINVGNPAKKIKMR